MTEDNISKRCLPYPHLVPRVGVASLSSPLEIGADRGPAAADDLSKRLEEAGCEVIRMGQIDTPERARAAGRSLAEQHVDAIALVPVCWWEDYLVLDLVEECDRPVLFWSLPGMETGALCGTQQATCYLKALGHSYRAAFGSIDDDVCYRKALVYLRAAALKARLRRARIGMAGSHLNGMTHTAANEFMLKKTIGPRVVFLDLPQLLERTETVSTEQAEELWQNIVSRVGQCNVSEKDGVESMRVYAALREAIEKEGLNAVTIGCYPHLMGKVCLAGSLLADDGIPMACEGDVHGATGQYMLQLLTDQPTHNTDWLDPVDGESAIFTHCGSGSFSLAEKPGEVELGSVRLMEQGVCALFTSKPGPVTLININSHGAGYQCAILEGEAVSTDMVFPGNPVRIRFNRPVSELIDWIHEAGLGHHWMIGYGHVGPEIREWARIVGTELSLLEP